MINKLTQRYSYENVEDFYKYTIKCPCCETILNFSKDDVYKSEDDMYTHHAYIDCPECNEKIQLSDDDYFGVLIVERIIDNLCGNCSSHYFTIGNAK